MTTPLFRVGGGYTSFVYGGAPLLYCQQVNDQAPRPVANPAPVQPMDAPYPLEVAFPKAAGTGTLQLTLFEQWASEVWDQFAGFAGAQDIVDVFSRQVALGSVTCVKMITLPSGGTRAVYYHGAVITDIDDSDNVLINTMLMPKGVTLTYLRRTRI